MGIVDEYELELLPKLLSAISFNELEHIDTIIKAWRYFELFNKFALLSENSSTPLEAIMDVCRKKAATLNKGTSTEFVVITQQIKTVSMEENKNRDNMNYAGLNESLNREAEEVLNFRVIKKDKGDINSCLPSLRNQAAGLSITIPVFLLLSKSLSETGLVTSYR